MKIGIDARFFGPESKGLGRYTQKLIEHLELIDHENDYVIFMTRANIDIYKPANSRFQKVLADYKWYTVSEQIFFPIALYRARCDFVHFPHFNVPLLYVRRFIVTIHDLILVRFPTRRASTRGSLLYWIKFLAYRAVIASAIHRATKIAAVSAFTKKDIVEHYNVDPGKISVTLEAGSDVYRTHNDISDDPVVLGESGEHSIIEPYLLYVGNAYPHKNLESLVDAFALWQERYGPTHVRQFHLVLVGRQDYFYARLAEHIAERGICGVTILGTVSNKRLHMLYARAEAFVFPSLYEGFGIPPLEACAYGVPVLSSRLTCMPEILGDAVLYCDVQSTDDLAEGIERILSDQGLRTTLQQKGPLQTQKYTWQRTAEETRELYDMM